jgi:hypothetical protein
MAFPPDAYRLIGGRNLAEKPAIGPGYSWLGLGLLKTLGMCSFCVPLHLCISSFSNPVLDSPLDADNVTSVRPILSSVER